MSRSVYPRIYGGKRLARGGGSASVDPLAVLAYDDASHGATNTTDSTFSALTAANGTLIACIASNIQAAGTITAFTADGNAMTEIGSEQQWDGTTNGVTFYAYEGFVGSTVEINVQFSASRNRIGLGVWSVSSAALIANMTTATIVDLSSVNTGDITIDKYANGLNLYFAGSGGGAAGHTWSSGPAKSGEVLPSNRSMSFAQEAPSATEAAATSTVTIGTTTYLGMYGLEVTQ